MTTLGTPEETARGFGLIYFYDDYGKKCSVQISSNAERSCIWLGIEDADPMVLCSQAHEVGQRSENCAGWQSYPLPKQVSLTTRMHLNEENVRALIGTLERWLETGDL